VSGIEAGRRYEARMSAYRTVYRRYPVENLFRYLCAKVNDPQFISGQMRNHRQYGTKANEQMPDILPYVICGISPSAWEDLRKNDTITERLADKIATALGKHISYLWPEYWDGIPEMSIDEVA
jgi:hypothetical protein